jgi:hypothetical protein
MAVHGNQAVKKVSSVTMAISYDSKDHNRVFFGSTSSFRKLHALLTDLKKIRRLGFFNPRYFSLSDVTERKRSHEK